MPDMTFVVVGVDDVILHLDGEPFAELWHSDLGEWTLDLADGRTFKRNTEQDAADLAAAIALAEA